MEKHFPLTDVTNGHATVETKGLYRVVFHNIRSERVRNIYRDVEFLTAEDAIQTAEMHNSLRLYCDGDKISKRTVWAEAVSYDATEVRWERDIETREQDEVATKARLAERQHWEKKTRKLKKKLKRAKAG